MTQRHSPSLAALRRAACGLLSPLALAALTALGASHALAADAPPEAAAVSGPAASAAQASEAPAAAAASAPAAEATEAPAAAASAASAASSNTSSARPAAAATDSTALPPATTRAAPSTREAVSAAPERSDLWQRVRSGLSIEDVDNGLVRKWEQYYAGRPDYVQRMMDRGSRFLFHIVEEVAQRGMPVDLALLPFIESAFNPQAMSVARAAGMWQFMPATGKEFSLAQNMFRDDRRDVLASTRAALDYLQRLHRRFGDWQLALAAYNWGQGNVNAAVERNRRAGLPTNYASLSGLPVETREYVPKLQAMKNIVLRPGDFGLALPPLENHPYFLNVRIERDIDVALAARLAGLSLEEFRALNPQHNKPVILVGNGTEVLLPYDSAQRFERGLSQHRGPAASWTAWKAPRNLRLAEAARITATDEDSLREMNRIPPRMLVKAGSTLLVPRHSAQVKDVAPAVLESATLAFAPEARPLRKLVLKAGRRGESVASVAKRHRVSPAQVAQWNGVAAGGQFKPGQKIVLMVAAPAPKAQAAGKPQPAKAHQAKPQLAKARGKQVVAKASASPLAKARAGARTASAKVARHGRAASRQVAQGSSRGGTVRR